MGSKIIFGILLFLFCIGIINAIEISGLNYIVKKNTKCGFNVFEHLTASSAIKCATKCNKRRGCFGVNFKRPQCEVLNYQPDNWEFVDAEGWRCIHELNECQSSPCINGNCIDGRNAYTCDCYPGFQDVNCEEDINECESSPCVHGECINNVNGYTCSCVAGYQGTNCDVFLLSRGKPTDQSSTYNLGQPSKAVDGCYQTHYFAGCGCTETNWEADPWWSVDLEDTYEIVEVAVTNRGDCCGSRLANFNILVTMDSSNPDLAVQPQHCAFYAGPVGQGQTQTILCDQPLIGRYIIIQILGSGKRVTLCEVDVKGRLVT